MIYDQLPQKLKVFFLLFHYTIKVLFERHFLRFPVMSKMLKKSLFLFNPWVETTNRWVFIIDLPQFAMLSTHRLLLKITFFPNRGSPGGFFGCLGFRTFFPKLFFLCYSKIIIQYEFP